MNREILYDRIGGAYDNTRRPDPFIARQLAAQFIPHDKNKTIDIACGTGNYTALLARQLGGHWTGVDQSARMLQVAAEKSQAIRWTTASVEALPFPAETFGSALCTNALHHFPSLRNAFREIRRTIKLNGRLVMFSATANQMRGYWLNEYFPVAMQRSIDAMPEASALQATLEECGFALQERIPYEIQIDLQDRFLYSGKHDPLLYLNPQYRAGISTFSTISSAAEVADGCKQLEADVRDGAFQEIANRYRNIDGDYSILDFGGGELKHSAGKQSSVKVGFRLGACALACTLACIASPLSSQGVELDPTVAHALDSLPTGTPLRVYLQKPAPYRVDGHLLRYNSGQLSINPTDSLARVARWNINDVQQVYALGRRSDGWAFGHGAGVGALTGLGIGVGVTAILLLVDNDSSCDSEFCIPPAAASAVLTIPFTAVATLIGGFIGLGYRDKWRSVPIPLAPAQSPK
ncbi:MAG: class I SAM-dependent methyltransferase [Gemmatimonadaceae bacterium]